MALNVLTLRSKRYLHHPGERVTYGKAGSGGRGLSGENVAAPRGGRRTRRVKTDGLQSEKSKEPEAEMANPDNLEIQQGDQRAAASGKDLFRTSLAMMMSHFTRIVSAQTPKGLKP